MSISTKVINNSQSNITAYGTEIPPGGKHEIPNTPIQLPDGVMVDVPGKGEIYLMEGGEQIHKHVKTSWGVRIKSGSDFQYWGYEGHPLMVVTVNKNGTYTITASDHRFTNLTNIPIKPTPTFPVRILSNKFSNVFLRMDASDLTSKKPTGGVVNCQFGEDDSELMSLIANPDGTHSFKSLQFANVYLRMDGTGVKQMTGPGGGVVNCHFGELPGPKEKFKIHKQPKGYTIESNKFPNVFLRISAPGVTEKSGPSGVVNCQYTTGYDEVFHLGHTLREAINSLRELDPGEKNQLEKYEELIVRQIIEGKGTAPDGIDYSVRIMHTQSIIPELPPCEKAIGIFVADIVFVVIGMWGIRVNNQERITRAVVRQLGRPTLRGFERAIRDFNAATTSYEKSKAAFSIMSGLNKAGGFTAVFHALKDEMSVWDWMKTTVIATAQLTAWFATDGIAFIAEFALVVATAEQMVEDGIKANKVCKGSSNDNGTPSPQSPFSQGFDSITEFKGKLLVTRAGEYIRYSDPIKRVLDPGYPYKIGSDYWGDLPSEFFKGFDAMFVEPVTGDLIVTKGSQYARYVNNTLSVVQPISKNWSNLPVSFHNGVDAIAILPNNKIYLIKGDQYVRGHLLNRVFEFEYQNPIKGNWGLEKVAGTDAFKLGFDTITMIGGKTYVFKGDQYLRYSDSNAMSIDPGYPRLIEENF